MTPEEEKKLCELSKENIEAFAPLYEIYYDKILNFLWRRTGDLHIAEDVTSATFEVVVGKMVKFQYLGEGSLQAWIYRIAINQLNKELFKKKFLRLFPFSHDSTISTDTTNEDNERIIDNYKDYAKVTSTMKSMKPNHQNMLHLDYFEGLSYSDMSKSLGKNINTVKSDISRALKELKKYLNY